MKQKAVWILELLFLVLPASLVAEPSYEETRGPNTVVEPFHASQRVPLEHQSGQAAEAPSHARLPANLAELTGVLGEGVECMTLETDDINKRLYTVIGNVQGHTYGDHVTVTYDPAHPVQRSSCMQGVTLAVQSIRPAKKK